MLKNKIIFVFLLTIFLTDVFSTTFVLSLSPSPSNQNPELYQQQRPFQIQGVEHAIYNVSSSYQVIVHQEEPVRTGSDNGIMLMIYEYLINGSKSPVFNLEQNLTASIIKNNVVLSVENLSASTTNSGTYMIPFKPTTTGSYYLGLHGVLGSTSINETLRLEDVSSVSDNVLMYVVLPLGFISIGSIVVMAILKARKK